jgi:hypothetical protein
MRYPSRPEPATDSVASITPNFFVALGEWCVEELAGLEPSLKDHDSEISDEYGRLERTRGGRGQGRYFLHTSSPTRPASLATPHGSVQL